MYHLICDVDGVLLRWTQGFAHWHNEYHATNYKLKSNGFLIDGMCGKPVHHKNPDIVDEFNSSYEFGKLSPILGSIECIEKIKRSGAIIDILTSCIPEKNSLYLFKDTQKMRVNNLTNLYGHAFRNINTISLKTNKTPFFVEMIETSPYEADKIFIVEDNIYNINEIAKELPNSAQYFLMDWGNGFLDNKPAPAENVKVVRSWADLYRQFT